MENKRILAFDTLRYILALCVLFGHTYLNLYRDGPTLVGMQNMAVDGFFILSGFLMAFSIVRTKIADENEAFLQLTLKRFKRLWPEFMFATVVILLLGMLFLQRYEIFPLIFNVFLLGQVNKIPATINGSWFISVLFFAGTFLQGILIYKKKVAVNFIIPTIVFLCFIYITVKFMHLSLHGSNYFVGDILSVGFIKGLMDIGLGMILYYITEYIGRNSLPIKEKYKPLLCKAFELFAVYLWLYSFLHGGPSKYDLLSLFAFSFIIPILALRKEFWLKFFSWKQWEKLTPTAYMLFLTHIVCLEIIRKYISYKEYPQPLVYFMVMGFCIIFAIICYHSQKWLFAKLKDILFVRNSQTSSQNIKGTR